jgi:hypothetical protein
MVTNTLRRDYDIGRIIDDYERRIAYLERQTLKLQPLITDSGWVAVPAAAGFTSTVEVRLQGNEVMYRGTLLPNVDWGAANSLQQPVATGGVPAEFRPPASLIYVGASGAGTAAVVFRVAIQSNGGIQVRCNTAAHTNSCSVNTDLLND